MLSNKGLLLCFLISLIGTPVALGGLIVRIENSTLTVGQGGSVDVLISSETGSPITVTDASFKFRLSPLDGTPRQLRFANPQLDSQLGDPNYLFFGSSSKGGDPPLGIPSSPVGKVSSSLASDDTFIGEDFHSTLLGTKVDSDELLLVTLDLLPGPGLLSATVGDRFRLELIEAGTSFLDLTNSDPLFDPFIEWTSAPATIRFTPVPEPSSILVFGCLLVAVGSRRPVRRLGRRW